MVVHGESGLLVPPGDMQRFAETVCEVLAEPSRRQRMGQAAYQHVARHHDLDVCVDRFEQLYSEVCSSHERG